VLEEGKRFRERHPLRWGLTREELRTLVGNGASPQTFGELLQELAEAGDVRLQGDKVRAGEGDVVFEGEAAAERDRLDALFRAAGCTPPDVSEAMDAGRARLSREVLLALVDVGVIHKINEDLFFHDEAMQRARVAMQALQSADGGITVGTFRDRLGISRKYAVPMLEHFDGLRVTRRDGDVRVLR
jgi:selenocysteine-specific elongation factor